MKRTRKNYWGLLTAAFGEGDTGAQIIAALIASLKNVRAAPALPRQTPSLQAAQERFDLIAARLAPEELKRVLNEPLWQKRNFGDGDTGAQIIAAFIACLKNVRAAPALLRPTPSLQAARERFHLIAARSAARGELKRVLNEFLWQKRNDDRFMAALRKARAAQKTWGRPKGKPNGQNASLSVLRALKLRGYPFKNLSDVYEALRMAGIAPSRRHFYKLCRMEWIESESGPGRPARLNFSRSKKSIPSDK